MMEKGGFIWLPIEVSQIDHYMGKKDVMGVLGEELFIVEKTDKLPDYIRYDLIARGKWYIKKDPYMEVDDVWERKNQQYKVVAAVPHETDPETRVYLIARREFGGDEVTYYATSLEFSEPAYQKSDWLG